MVLIERIFRAAAALAAVLAIAALAHVTFAGHAQAAGAAPPAPPLSLDPKALPQAPAASDADKLKSGEPGESGIKIPDGIQFGDHVLQFETKRDADIPRVGVEAADPTVINKAAPESPLKPDYFGLKFSTPIQR